MTDKTQTTSTGSELATLGGGCFWCLEAVFDQVKGVDRVESGYMGGGRPNPTYEAVCTGTTGYAEIIQIRFDPNVISFREILEIFFRHSRSNDIESTGQRCRHPISFGYFLSFTGTRNDRQRDH